MEIWNDTYIVYIHTNKINDKKYVGITSQDPQKRWGYKGLGYKHCPKMWNAINKYGWENFDHEIFAANLTYEEAANMERILIKALQTTNDAYGYNVDSGGFSCKHALESIEKIRKANQNKTVSAETKRKIKAARAAQVLSEKHLNAFKYNFRGKHHSEATKKRLHDAHKQDCKAVMCVETGVVYASITEAHKQTGVAKSSLSVICNTANMNRTAGGYHWRFAA